MGVGTVSYIHKIKMTLDRLSERIAEASSKTSKVDGRRFSTKSQIKMKWEMRDIVRSIQKNRRVSTAGLYRGLYTKEEMKEYSAKESPKKESIEESKELVESDSGDSNTSKESSRK